MNLTKAIIKFLTYAKTENKAGLRFDDELRDFGRCSSVSIWPNILPRLVSQRIRHEEARPARRVRSVHDDPGSTPSAGNVG